MGRPESIGELDAEFDQGADFQRPIGQLVLERPSCQELHGDERAAFELADIVNRANVGMVQSRG